jgi:hypothetical protein
MQKIRKELKEEILNEDDDDYGFNTDMDYLIDVKNFRKDRKKKPKIKRKPKRK